MIVKIGLSRCNINGDIWSLSEVEMSQLLLSIFFYFLCNSDVIGDNKTDKYGPSESDVGVLFVLF